VFLDRGEAAAKAASAAATASSGRLRRQLDRLSLACDDATTQRDVAASEVTLLKARINADVDVAAAAAASRDSDAANARVAERALGM
jgi:hypothetical protein